jgi:hypothetical protein
MADPEISYQTLKTYDDFEVRLYGTETLIEAVQAEPFEDAGSKGFKPLFRYINGQNRTQQQIAMTRPVLTVPVETLDVLNGKPFYTLQFFLPQPWIVDTAPLPTQQNVALKAFPARKIATRRYSGFWTEKKFQEQVDLLLQSLTRENFTPQGPAYCARYNPPTWPLWFLRRNEVWIEIA